jgi:choline dehydrogenase
LAVLIVLGISLAALIITIIILQRTDRINHKLDKEEEEVKLIADYIFVGVGSTSSVAIRRIMDAHPEVTILAFEPGKNRNDDPNVKLVSNFLIPWQDPRYSRGILSVPDPNLLNQQVAVQLGEMIGGSGNHDFMQTFYPSQHFCDTQWVTAGGDFWNWTNTQRRLKSSESFLGFAPSGNRGASGPLSVLPIQSEPNGSASEIILNLMPSIFTEDTGATRVEDYNLGQELSYTMVGQTWWRPTPNTFLPLYRSSPGLDYIGPILTSTGRGIPGYENLSVLTQHLVDRVIFDSMGHATGVIYTAPDGSSGVAYARKEVIISAGGVYSPGVLERSGYGDKARLTELGIETIYDNPMVGENMRNQPSPLFAFNCNETAFNPFAFVSFQALLSVIPEAAGRRTIELFGSAAFSGLLPPAVRALKNVPAPSPAQTVAVFAFLVEPHSSGSVHIVSKLPGKEPLVIHNTYTDADDFDINIEVATMRHLKALIDGLVTADPSRTYEVVYPTAEAWADVTDAVLKAQIGASNVYSAHWASTCLMGPAGEGVVDSELKVQGVKRLRVADISVMPLIPANTRSAAIAIGEALAELIIADIEA